ncbi:lasso peptide biosynthesis B2 protein [Paenibacillus sp. FSL H8-0034]|uniref:lasso peptide biosynthesis B2 protein n=1 Tax=Paenibacillus sp. FSL H8-0034 TaxID=2954671 RepID=UPI0030F9A6C0
MVIVNKVKVLFSLDISTFVLLVEALFYLAWARILIHMPFSRVAPSLGDAMQETTFIHNDLNRATLIQISSAISTMSNHTLWESKCLVKAIAGMKMLARRKMESTLYLGTAKDESSTMIAHAWLRSGSFFITGKESMEKFTVVGKFAKRMKGNR